MQLRRFQDRPRFKFKYCGTKKVPIPVFNLVLQQPCGIKLLANPNEPDGVFIHSIKAGSHASGAQNLCVGMRIVSVNNRDTVSTTQSW
jgi:hypothetical protein